jgi:hypothetical protein
MQTVGTWAGCLRCRSCSCAAAEAALTVLPALLRLPLMLPLLPAAWSVTWLRWKTLAMPGTATACCCCCAPIVVAISFRPLQPRHSGSIRPCSPLNTVEQLVSCNAPEPQPDCTALRSPKLNGFQWNERFWRAGRVFRSDGSLGRGLLRSWFLRGGLGRRLARRDGRRRPKGYLHLGGARHGVDHPEGVEPRAADDPPRQERLQGWWAAQALARQLGRRCIGA